MKKKIFYLFISLILISCNKDDSNETIDFEPFNFNGVFTVNVQKIEPSYYGPIIQQNEIITQVNDSTFKTTTSATFSPDQLNAATEFGFTFYRNVTNNEIHIPSQNLAQVYTNQLRGFSLYSEPHGYIIDANSFQLIYEVTNTSNASPYPRYLAVYTRN